MAAIEEALGDKLFDISIVTFLTIWLAGWIVVLSATFVEWLFPKTQSRMEEFTNAISKPLGIIQKYALIAAALLFLVRLLTSWLGWGPQNHAIVD